MAGTEYRAFLLEGDAPLQVVAAMRGLTAEPQALRDWLADVVAAGGAHRRVLPDPRGLPRLVTALALGDGAGRRHLLLTLRDPGLPHGGPSTWLEAERLDAAARTGGALSHSMNNSLTAILGNADLLAGMEGLPESARRAATLVLSASERLEVLARRLIRLSRALRPGEGKSEPGAVLQGLVERRRAVLPCGIRLDLALGADLGTLLVDPQLLEAVLGEAVANSVAAALDGEGRIRIMATLTPGEAWPGFRWLAIAVRDDGPGFPATALAAPAWDALPGATRGAVGNGHAFGLAILRGFAEAMGGALDIGNPSEGGSRLVMTLPVLADARTANRTAPEDFLQSHAGPRH